MATRTLAQLLVDVRNVANVLNNSFIQDSELTDWVNQAVGELYDLVIATYEHYYVSFFSFSLAGGQSGNSQALSGVTGGFYKDNTLEKDPGTSSMRIERRLSSFIERDGGGHRTYDIIGTPPVLFVYPPEQSAGPYRLLYTPDAPVLAGPAPGPQVDLDSTLTKWYRYVVYRAAIDVHRKRRKDDEAMMLAGNQDSPQPGTLAGERLRVLSMAHNKLESPQQVPLARPRGSGFWNWDDNP